MALCQPVTTNQMIPFPLIISHKVSYMRVHMFVQRHKRYTRFASRPRSHNTPCDKLSHIHIDSYIIHYCYCGVLIPSYIYDLVLYVILLCYVILFISNLSLMLMYT